MAKSECYWNNLGDIIIIVDNGNAVKERYYKISYISRRSSNDGTWTVVSNFQPAEDLEKNHARIVMGYRHVENWLFAKTFAPLYIEMKIFFELQKDQSCLSALEKVFSFEK